MTNANTRWSIQDRVTMYKLLAHGVPTDVIADAMGRTQDAITSQHIDANFVSHVLPTNITFNIIREQIICATVAGLLTLEDIK
jgi:hypothetical protein